MANSLSHSEDPAHAAGAAIGTCASPHARRPRGLHELEAANDSGRPGNWKFALTLGPAELKRGDVVNTLLDVLVILPGGRHHARQLCLILSELFSNALDHGLLQLDAAAKARAGSLDAYIQTKAAALAALDHGSIEILLELASQSREPVLEITLRDSGAGFDYRSRDSGAIARGRGIALVSALCSGIQYRGCGNEVSVSYALTVPQAERLRRMA